MDEKNPPVKNKAIIVGIILIAVGLLFIAGKFLNLGGITRLWPLFLFIPVVVLASTLLRDPRKNSGTVIPAVILTVLGIFFLWLNFTDWEHISIAWPIFIIAPGLGVLSSWLITRERSQLTAACVILTVGLALFFRTLLHHWGIAIDRLVLLGIVLVVSGILVLIMRNRENK